MQIYWLEISEDDNTDDGACMECGAFQKGKFIAVLDWAYGSHLDTVRICAPCLRILNQFTLYASQNYASKTTLKA